jgi:hypothetical protein
MDLKFSIYNAKTKTFSPEKFVFDPRDVKIQQAHPCWGYSHGKYRVFYCQETDQGDFIAEVTADRWSDLQSYVVSNNEPVVTPDLRSHPHTVYLPVDSSNAWLFYITRPLSPPRLAYSIFDKGEGWDKTQNLIPSDKLVGQMEEGSDLGSALKEGNDIVLYAAVDKGKNESKAYRFKSSDKGNTWTADPLVVSGIDEPFRQRRLFVRVVKKGDTYYLSSQSHACHRWLSKSDDGINFELVADFGKRPSFGNEMVDIEGTGDLLLIYAGSPDQDRKGPETSEIEKHLECLIYDTRDDPSA